MEKQTVKVITYRGRDAPDIAPRLAALESSLRAFVGDSSDSLGRQVAEALATIESWKSSQELANGVMDSSISEIEQKVSEILSALEGKTDTSEFKSLQKDLLTIVSNLNRELGKKANIADIPKPVDIVADSNNVTITKKDDNTYGIAVDIQEKITETVIKEVSRGGGLSRAAIIKLILQYGGGSPTPTYSVDVTCNPVVAEVGQTVNPLVAWAYTNGFIATSQLLNGNSVLGTDFNDIGITTSKTYTLVSENAEGDSITDTDSITFGYLRYFGVYSPDIAIDEANVKLLSNQLVFSRGKSITLDCTGGNRVVYAYPKSYGLATVKDANGFLFNDFFGGIAPSTINITNGYGEATDYYVYQTFNKYNSSSVTFIFS